MNALRCVWLMASCLVLPVEAASPQFPNPQRFAQIERGRYLALLSDCAACHLGPDNETPYAGGRPIPTPFGTLLAPNITPDVDTGIGTMTDAEFDAVVRAGRMPDGSRVYPAMPYPYYAKMSAGDVRAIRAYLNTIPAKRNAVKSNQLPFPFSVRASMWFWDALFFEDGELRPDARQSAEWNRGAYIVLGPGHCGACHTPKNLLGGDKEAHMFEGFSLQGWFAPNITNDQRTGLGRWSTEDIREYLKRGHNKLSAASGPMGEEVNYSSANMTDADLGSIAAYLKSRAARSETPSHALRRDDPRMQAGEAIYRDLCAACHKQDGSGVPYLFPNLAQSPAIEAAEPISLVRVVLQGAETVATPEEPTAPQMPSFGWQLTDEQVAAVTTYLRNSWSHTAPSVEASFVRKARRDLHRTESGGVP